jgi:hypothetical protein
MASEPFVCFYIGRMGPGASIRPGALTLADGLLSIYYLGQRSGLEVVDFLLKGQFIIFQCLFE